jgi:hypothetical protein
MGNSGCTECLRARTHASFPLGWQGVIRWKSLVSVFKSNKIGAFDVQLPMILRHSIALLLLMSVTALPGQTCREVQRDAAGRIVSTTEYRSSFSGVRAVTRDASGRIIGTATARQSFSGPRTEFRDASGRITGTAVTRESAGSATTTYRDPSGRVTGTAKSRSDAGVRVRTEFRDAAGRPVGSSTSSRTSGHRTTSATRDAAGRVIATGSRSGVCPPGLIAPQPIRSAPK